MYLYIVNILCIIKAVSISNIKIHSPTKDSYFYKENISGPKLYHPGYYVIIMFGNLNNVGIKRQQLCHEYR